MKEAWKKSREGRDLLSWMLNLFQVLSNDDLSLYILMPYDLRQERRVMLSQEVNPVAEVEGGQGGLQPTLRFKNS